MTPIVSVVVATYKRDRELREALDSLAVQTYRDFEVVLVDDNGNAEWNTRVEAIVNRFRETYPEINLRYIANTQNKGSAKTRNIGIDAAQGEYVTFLDDDDVYLPEKIEKQLENMLLTDADIGITDLYLYSEDGHLVDRRIRSFLKGQRTEDYMKCHLMYHMTGTDTMMFRKSYLRDIGGFDPIDVGDEFYLMQKALLSKGKLAYLPECHVKAYVHTGEENLSSGDGKIKGENALYEYKKEFFKDLDAKSRRYIRMRHFAVLAFAEIRRKRYTTFLVSAIRSFLAAPLGCVGLLVEKFRDRV